MIRSGAITSRSLSSKTKVIQAWKYFAPKSWEFRLHVYNTQVISPWSTMENFTAFGTNNFKTAFCGVNVKLMLRPELIWPCEAIADHVAWVLESRLMVPKMIYHILQLPDLFPSNAVEPTSIILDGQNSVFTYVINEHVFQPKETRKRLHKNRVQFPEDYLGTPT